MATNRSTPLKQRYITPSATFQNQKLPTDFSDEALICDE
jgi:hypothetical protein